jgi:hypothetical protein
MPPTLFIKNALRLSEFGLGDGTIYASGSGATPNAAQKTFALAGLSILADIGADGDDKFNGHLLYFPASGNRYHIVDWVAGTDTATVWEPPSLTDTGAWQIRRALVCNKQLPGNPAHRLADGQRFADWKSASNTVIEAHLPNLVDNGGFETGVLSPWIKTVEGGTADATIINSVSPAIGTFELKINRGDRTSITITQPLRTLQRNRIYRLLFKARTVTTFVPDNFTVRVLGTGADLTASNPIGGTIQPGLVSFVPTLTSTNTWYSLDLTAPGWDVVGATIELKLWIGMDEVFIDELYLFEKVNVGALLLFDHGGLTSLTNLTGRYVSKDRSGQTVAVDNVQILGAQTIRGGDVGAVQFASAVYPIYTIESSNLIAASEILLAQKWVWGRHVMMPFDPELIEKEESIFRSRSGVESSVVHSRRRRYKGRVRLLNDTDRDTWKNDWYPHHHDPRHPFAVQIDSSRPIVLMVDDEAAFGLEYDSVRPARNFNWVEVVK